MKRRDPVKASGAVFPALQHELPTDCGFYVPARHSRGQGGPAIAMLAYSALRRITIAGHRQIQRGTSDGNPAGTNRACSFGLVVGMGALPANPEAIIAARPA